MIPQNDRILHEKEARKASIHKADLPRLAIACSAHHGEMKFLGRCLVQYTLNAAN